MRPLALPVLTLTILTLVACYDFPGDRGRLGFQTDATIDGIRAWTPNAALAEGARPRLAVSEVLATEREPEGSVTFDGTRSIELIPDGPASVIVTGGGRAWIGAVTDGVRDELRIRWATPERAELFDPVWGALGEDAPLETLAIVEGGRALVGFRVLDRRGVPLGYVRDQLDVRSGDRVELDTSGGLVVLGRDVGPDTLVLAWPGTEAAALAIEVVSADAIDALHVERLELDGECGLYASLWAEGMEVRGATGFRWSHTADTGPWAPCAPGVEATWGELESRG